MAKRSVPPLRAPGFLAGTQPTSPAPKAPKRGAALRPVGKAMLRTMGSMTMPGSKNYVPRKAKVSTGTPGTKNYVPRVAGGANQPKPGGSNMGRFVNVLQSVVRAKASIPRKPRSK